jgi:hypothetical protein
MLAGSLETVTPPSVTEAVTDTDVPGWASALTTI